MSHGLLVLSLLALGEITASAQQLSSGANVIDADVYSSIDQSADGRVYVLVLLKEPPYLSGAAFATRMDLVRQTQETVLGEFEPSDFEPAYVYKTFPGFTGRVDWTGLAKLAAHPQVAAVGVDVQATPLLRESRPYLGADKVQTNYGLTGVGVTVALVDSGIDKDHPDLSDNIAPGAKHFINQGQDVGPGAVDDVGHGTFIAGIITSKGVQAPPGIAIGADILPVKVWGEHSIWDSDIIAGVDYVASIKSNYANLSVMNTSLGFDATTSVCPCDNSTTANRMLSSSMAVLYGQGVTITAPTGNSGSCTKIFSPACFSTTISVGGVYDAAAGKQPDGSGYATENGICVDTVTAAGLVGCFSDRNDCTDVFAPAGPTVSCLRGGGADTPWPATSWASGHCAGVVALMTGAGRCTTPDQIKAILKRTGTLVTDKCNPARQIPVINALAAVTEVLATSPPCNADCNHNSVPDSQDIQSGTSKDCNRNSIPDECDLASGAAQDVNGNSIPDSCEPRFLRGDANESGEADLSDAIFVLLYLFAGSVHPSCLDAAEANDDGRVDASDAIYLLSYLFTGGPRPAAPIGTCGVDPTVDSIGCQTFGPCP
jgi:subtilisin family serine protease